MMRLVLALAAGGALLSSLSAAQEPPAAVAAAPPPVPAANEWRAVAPENLLVIDTTKGRILVELAPQAAPGHVARIVQLANSGFYDGQRWHRVIDWFMAQTGDPLGTGEGQSPYEDLTAEFTFRRGADTPFTPVASPAGTVEGFSLSLPVVSQPDALMANTSDNKVHGWGTYCPGVAGMARGAEENSANSQFFIMRQPYPSLDKRYTVWGMTVAGLDVVRALSVGEPPAEPDRMTRVRTASALPEGERPAVRVLDTGSAFFRNMAEQARAARGADFSVCDLALPAEVSAPAAYTSG
ncbi:peptidylprolyl isomerase [Brevundimonas sp. 2R-24]|uniref:peptidylprolyl isomerase n=1 Tax=Peiella sedimenti TaxID=3061083 RepID=A0ABT8SKD2_9CAUL|nr:peptidylprolyl isomerase [Caulobacteraceae bacterium XZ-24]